MGWLRKSTDVAGRTDAVASWGERAAKLVVWTVGPSAVSGLAVGIYGWVTANPLYGIAFGFMAFALVQLALTLREIRKSANNKGPFADPVPVPAGGREDHKLRGISEAEVRHLKTNNEQLQQQVERLTAERDHLLEQLRVNNDRLESQPGDEELKSECFQISTDCYQFVRAYGGTELGDYLDPEVRRRNDEVMLEYDQTLGGRVNSLLRKLQRRGWWQPETLEPKKPKHIEDPGFLSDVQDIARELNAIAHEH